jgi:hypothetical protein
VRSTPRRRPRFRRSAQSLPDITLDPYSQFNIIAQTPQCVNAMKLFTYPHCGRDDHLPVARVTGKPRAVKATVGTVS